MPVAVVKEKSERFDLKTLEGGWVEVRQMSYGERLLRSGLTGKLKVAADKKSEFMGELAMETAKLAEWDFAHLVTDHNLEDADGRKLNLANKADLNKLAANIGEEVGSYIDKLNSFEDIEEGN